MVIDLAPVARRLRRVLGDAAVTADASGLVVAPRSAEQVRFVVRECAYADVPFVARGAGSAGVPGAVLIVTGQMRRILDVDLANQRAVVEPGVVNLAVSEAVGPEGYCFAPDPSGLVGYTIGGNVAENAGGARCLKYGYTAHHVTGVELCTPEGDLVWLGAGKAAECAGYDLVGVLVGAEGTLGIVTKVALRLVRAPEAVVTVLAGFRTAEDAGAAASAVIGSGLTPVAAEIMDSLAVQAAGRAVGYGYPLGAGAVLLVECDGPVAEVEAQVADVALLCQRAGAFALRRITDEAERAELWHARTAAFGVVPRGRLAEVLRGDDLDTMRRVRRAFDPQRLANPGKALPALRLCGERR